MYLPHYITKLKNAILQSMQLLEQGKINVPIERIYPFERVKEAIQHRINGGKVLLSF
jgi:NADPH:quinone reductase-like Zn-dependent oxidoreductase